MLGPPIGRLRRLAGLALALGLLAAAAASATPQAEEALRAARELCLRDGPAGDGFATLQPGSSSATLVLNQLKLQAPHIDPPSLAPLRGFIERPTGLSGRLDTEHFRIHYAPGGPDQPAGWPSTRFLEELAAVCEPIHEQSHGLYGWPLPPGDGEAGGDGRVDIYIRDLGWGVFGYTIHEEIPSARGKAGFIVLDNDFAGLTGLDPADAARVTLAHEYQHLIQFGFGYAVEAEWFMEQCATMMEGRLCPDIHELHGYLPYHLQRPHRRLDLTDGSFEYGAWLWPEFLTRWRDDPGILPEIWAAWAQGGRTMLQAIDASLRRAGESLDRAFLEWAVWNAFLEPGGAPPAYGYEGGIPGAVAPALVLAQYPAVRVGPPMILQPEPLAASYVELRPGRGSADNSLEITLQTCATTAEARLIQWSDGGYTVMPIRLDGGRGHVVAGAWDVTDRALLVVVNGSGASGCCDYRVSAATTFRSAGVDDDGPLPGGVALSASPNPCEPYTLIQFQLPEALPVSLRLYDAQGRLAETLIDALCSPGRHAVRWSGETRGSAGAAVFFCEIRTPLGTDRLRLVRLR